MKLYADLGARRAWQVSGDLLLVGWVLVWTWFGRAVHDAVVALGAVGEQLEAGGTSLAGNLGDAGDRAAGVPLVGDDLRTPFDRAAGAAESLAAAGRSQQEVVAQLGLLLGLGCALIPIALAALLWVPRRVAFVRRAGATARHLDAAASLELFALRAMAGQPMHRLARVSDDPLGAWRSGDSDVVGRLADLELREMGLRVPAHLRGRPE
ncbi:MAG TPA: hypothetical protein VHG70_08010 [Nocardioidaceae bacterium]|nr:hypothetical protein [Nocardioidaceae bacterium]